jgi:hypothetical protein
MALFCPSDECFSSYCAAICRWSYELHVLPCKNSRTVGRIFMKFGMEVVSLRSSSNVMDDTECKDDLLSRHLYP